MRSLRRLIAGWLPSRSLRRLIAARLPLWLLRRLIAPRKQRCDLLRREVAPAADRQLAQVDMHDADALERQGRVAKCFGHAADLAIETLGKGDPEHPRAKLHDLARPGRGVREPHTARHARHEFGRDRVIDGDDVFLLVMVLGPQHLVDDITIVREEDQAFRVLVEPTDRKHPFGMIHEIYDVAFDVALRGAGDADGLVERDVDRADLLACGADRVTIEAHVVPFGDLRAERGRDAVDGDAALGDEGVGLPPRACAALAQVFVESQTA